MLGNSVVKHDIEFKVEKPNSKFMSLVFGLLIHVGIPLY